MINFDLKQLLKKKTNWFRTYDSNFSL